MVSASEGQCVKYSNDVSYLVSGIDRVGDNSELSIYPNPVNNGVIFVLADFMDVNTIMVSSIGGKIVLSKSIKISVPEPTLQEIELPGDIHEGIYCLILVKSNFSIFRTFLVHSNK
ncbi:MAG: T9SS type A sorting domain-containing protein, partial [Cyclobacteriaceae bacterium]|nr:T9SS type A sorting domain-containing protein [Cyclobacteriaceae bacterium]